MESSTIVGNSPVDEREMRLVSSLSRAGHEKPCLNPGGPPSKAKYELMTDSEVVPCCVQLIISAIISLMVSYYMDTRSNSRANTCEKGRPYGNPVFIRFRTNTPSREFFW